MSPFRYLSRLLLVFLIASPIVLNGCSYIPWIGDDDEDDLAFEEDFPFEDEEVDVKRTRKRAEDDFFEDEGGFTKAEGEDDEFSDIDQRPSRNDLKGDLESLQTQQEALISKVRELEETIITLEPKIDAAQERLDGGSGSRVEFLEPEVEELKLQVARLNAEIDSIKGKKSRTSRRSSAGGFSGGSNTTPDYDRALAAYRNGNFDESILLFQNLALSNPPPSLQDNIVFWIGSNYQKLEMYDDAIKQYQTVLNRYPRGNKVHDSRFMLGVSFYKKGESSRAVEILEGALRNNPPADVKGKILAQLREIQ